MFTRRTMLRALGLGVPAAAVAAAVGLPKYASGGYVPAGQSYLMGESALLPPVNIGAITAAPVNVGTLSAISANMGTVTAGRFIDGDAVWDLGAGTLTIPS